MPSSTPARLRMLISHTGSPDGQHIYRYTAGEVYDAHSTPQMTAHLAAIFLQAGWAEDADALPTPVAASEPAPEPASIESPASPRRAQRRPGPTERKGADREPAAE